MSGCASCGKALSRGAVFCSHCGAQVESSTQPPPATPTAAHEETTVLYVAPTGHAGRLRLARTCAFDHHAIEMHAEGPGDVQARLKELDAAGVDVSAVCLLGTHDELPHARFRDDTDAADWVLSDNDYGMLQEATEASRASALALPDVPVCRIPCADPDTLKRLLETRDALADSWTRGVAVSCSAWESASRAVLQSIARRDRPALTCIPPQSSLAVAEMLGQETGRLYFNVHGSDQVAYWIGEGEREYPPAIQPDQISVAPNAVMVSEACFGARHDYDDGRPMAIAFFEAGGGAFVGSTVIAWGPVAPPIGQADLIVTGVYAALDAGHTLPEALLAAKANIVRSAGEPLSPVARNTISSFVAYGGPMARVTHARLPLTRSTGAGTWANRPVTRSTSGPGDVLNRVRQTRLGYVGGPLGAARAQLAARAARMGYTPVTKQAMSLHDVQRRYPHAHELQARLQEALRNGGEIRHLSYRERTGAKTALVVTPQSGGHAQLLMINPSGSIQKRLVARR